MPSSPRMQYSRTHRRFTLVAAAFIVFFLVSWHSIGAGSFAVVGPEPPVKERTQAAPKNVVESTLPEDPPVVETLEPPSEDEPADPTPAPRRINRSSPNNKAPHDDAVEWLQDLLEFAQNSSSAHHGTEVDVEDFCDELAAHMWESELPQLEEKYPLFVEALRKQKERHIAVASGRPFPGQKYLVWSLSGGMGNRFQSLSSTFVAAMLSDRVFLMKDWFTPLPKNSRKNVPVIYPSKRTTEYVLEPLDKLFDREDLRGGKRAKNNQLLCPLMPVMSLREFEAIYPNEFLAQGVKDNASHSPLEEHVKIDISAKHDRTMARWNRFMCSNLSDPVHSFKPSYMGEESLRGREGGSTAFFSEKFVYVWTNQYYLPALYANPFHGRRLKAMLPPAKVYSILLRILALPSRAVLLRIGNFLKREELQPRQFHAMQVRPFHDKDITTMARSFDECYSKTAAGEDRFFLATIWPQIYKYFKRKYKSRVVTQLAEHSMNADQKTSDAVGDQEALSDMLLLSMAKELFVSPGSTFGVFAMAFGEIDVTKVNFNPRSQSGSHPMCERVTSHQSCFGAWFERDHLVRRLRKLSCKTLALPQDLMNCS